MRKEGQRLIIEPAPAKTLLALLATLPTLMRNFRQSQIRRLNRLIFNDAISAQYAARTT